MTLRPEKDGDPGLGPCGPLGVYQYLLLVRLPNKKQVERIISASSLPPPCPLPLCLQRNFSMSVNSAAVMRLTGRGGGPIAGGAPRGRSTSRGRGKKVSHFNNAVGESSVWKPLFCPPCRNVDVSCLMLVHDCC